jgi:hypothetical protein
VARFFLIDPRAASGAKARRSEQPAQQTSQASQYSLKQPEDTGQQTADGTPETPQQAHRV